MVYSFEDVQATLNGPGGSISLGAGAGNAQEGISFEFLDDKDGMLIGADGSVVHSLRASKAARGRCCSSSAGRSTIDGSCRRLAASITAWKIGPAPVTLLELRSSLRSKLPTHTPTVTARV